MVRDATNVTAGEALEANLIDIVASDDDDLLAQLDGFEVQGPRRPRSTPRASRSTSGTCRFQYELLQIIVNPNVAFLLILAGMIGLVVEIFSPGLDPAGRDRAGLPGRRAFRRPHSCR